MSKTFFYILAVIGVYLAVIFPKVAKASESESEQSENKSEETEGEVKKGADGQRAYRFGVTL